MLLLLTDSLQKLKLKTIHDTLIILFYVSLGSPQLQDFSFLNYKHKKNDLSSASEVGIQDLV